MSFSILGNLSTVECKSLRATEKDILCLTTIPTLRAHFYKFSTCIRFLISVNLLTLNNVWGTNIGLPIFSHSKVFSPIWNLRCTVNWQSPWQFFTDPLLLSAMNSLKYGERHMFFMSGHFSTADCLISKIKNVCHGFTPAKSDQFSLGFFYRRRAKRIQSLESVRTRQNQKGFPIHTSFDLLIWKQNSGFFLLLLWSVLC